MTTTKTQLAATGFQKDVNGYWIEKDPQARLIYTLDWSDWLLNNDTIASVQYTVTNTGDAQNDLTIVSSGSQLNYTTFVELSKGVNKEIYTITAKVTTAEGLIDRRSFRIKIKERAVQ